MTISFSLDDLSASVIGKLQIEAERRGVDVKDVVIELIKDGIVHTETANSSELHHDLDALAGTWSADEAAAFLSSVSDMRKCDEDLWK
ncbi:MAG: hypothetical protein GX594_09245 [Pirellulaceae bacterium]|nr:hypothetical protein [Pirellulaceae bacterium]